MAIPDKIATMRMRLEMFFNRENLKALKSAKIIWYL